MENPEILIMIEPGASLPLYKTDGAAGADLRAHLTNVSGTICIEPGKRVLVPTGLRIQLPSGFEAQVRSRSGLALEYGVVCLNSPGTIDSDYRGEIKVILANLGDAPFAISHGDRIAQLIVSAVSRADFRRIENLEDTSRGSGGFGSTGI